MDSITLRLQPDTIKSLGEEADDHDVSRSEYVRNIIRSCYELQRLRDEHERIQDQHEQELEEVREEYGERIADLERENERLHRQLAATNKRVDQHQELVG